MKKLLFILFALTGVAKAQTIINSDSIHYTTMTAQGYGFKSVIVQKNMILPTDTTSYKCGVTQIGTVIYVGNCEYWTAVAGTGTVIINSSTVDSITYTPTTSCSWKDGLATCSDFSLYFAFSANSADGTRTIYFNSVGDSIGTRDNIHSDLTEDDNFMLTSTGVNAFTAAAGPLMVADLTHLQTVSRGVSGTMKTAFVTDTSTGGLFKYSAEALTDDGGTIFPATGGGHWVREYDHSLGVRADWWGLIGDNSTDNTPLIPRLNDVTGVINFKGTYLITDTVNVVSNQIWRGDRKENTIIKLADSSAEIDGGGHVYNNPVIRLIGVENFSLENLTIDGNNAGQKAGVVRTSCVEITNQCSNLRFVNCSIINARTGPGYTGGYGIVSWGRSDGVLVQGCYFSDNGQSDIGLFDGKNWIIRDNQSRNTGYSCLNIETTTNAPSIHNIIADGWIAVNAGRIPISVIRNVNSGRVYDIHISNFNIDTCGFANDGVGAIRIRGTERVTLDHISINQSRGTAIAVTADNNWPIDHLSLSNINIHNAGKYGVHLVGADTNYINDLNLLNVRVDTSTSFAYNFNWCKNITAQNIYANNTGGLIGMNVWNTDGFKVNTGILDSTGTYGIRLNNVLNANIENVSITNVNFAGIWLTGTTDYVSITNNLVKDLRIPQQADYGVYANVSDYTTVNPHLNITSNDFSRVSSIPMILGGIGTANITRLLNQGDGRVAVTNAEVDTISGAKYFDGLLVSRNTLLVGKYGANGNIRFVDDTAMQKWSIGLFSIPGNQNFTVYDYKQSTPRLTILGTTGAATFTSTVGGSRATSSNHFTILSQLNTDSITVGTNKFSQWSTSGSNAYYPSTGNVGIGRIPTARFDVADSLVSDIFQVLIDNKHASGGSGIKINRTATARAAQIQFSTSGTGDWWSGVLRNAGSATTGFHIGTGSDVSTTTPVLSLTTSGRAGIGNISPTSNLHTTSFATAYRAISALRTLDITDNTIECTSGTFTVTLPTSVGITGREYWITNTGSGTITIGTTSSQTFINVTATPTTLTVAQFTNYKVVSNGTGWLAYKIVN